MVNFLKYCNIFQCCLSRTNNTNNTNNTNDSFPISPPSPKSYLHLNKKSINSLIKSYLNKNTIFNPFDTNQDILIEPYKTFLHEECMICLEENYIKKCIKNTCCNCVLHSECFEEWCLKHNKIICPLCQKKILK